MLSPAAHAKSVLAATESNTQPRLIALIVDIARVCASARRAQRFYEDVKSASDATLALKGLQRGDLPRATFEKLTEAS